MERKTIGGLIAALRRANGMTQRELAERLHVSDKTVSRWERDEGTPDLALIPVLAEIFGVTCDELLRGERLSPEDRASGEPAAPERTEKQRQRLLRTSLTRFRNRSWIAAGIAVLGLLAAAVANLGFLRATIGFLAGAVCTLVAVICQAIWTNGALLAVSDDSLPAPDYSAYRRDVAAVAERVYLLIAALFGCTVPLLLVDDAYQGLSGGSWLAGGLITGGIVALLGAVVLYVLHGIRFRRGDWPMTEAEQRRFLHNRRWKRICTLSLLAAAAVTAVLHLSLTEIWGTNTVMQGTRFTDYESFVAYMEQDIPWTIGEPAPAPDSAVAPVPDAEEPAQWETLEDSEGNVVCEYQRRNHSVVSIRYAQNGDTILPITVYTYDDLYNAQRTVAGRHKLFAAVYCAEALAALLLYLKKRVK